MSGKIVRKPTIAVLSYLIDTLLLEHKNTDHVILDLSEWVFPRS
jgi:hypothetical protein